MRASERGRAEVRVAQTAFVDVTMSRGDACGRLCEPARPYRTIGGAIDAIRAVAPLVTALPADGAPAPPVAATQWTVRAAPGVYAENVKLPPRVGLVGAGRGCTVVVGSVAVTGDSRVEDLDVRSPTLPALAVALEDGHARVSIQRVAIEALAAATAEGARVVVDIVQTVAAAQGAVAIQDTTIAADLTGPAATDADTPAAIRARGVHATMDNVDVRVTIAPGNGIDAVAVDAGARVDLSGGSVTVVVGPTPPQADIVLLAARNDSAVYQSGDTVAYVLEAVALAGAALATDIRRRRRQFLCDDRAAAPKRVHAFDADRADDDTPQAMPARGEVFFARAGPNSVVQSQGAIIDFETVPLGSAVLASAEAPNASAAVVGARMRFGFVPPVRGNATYVASSQGGNMVSSGGLYTNVRALRSDQPGGTQRFLADSDGTVLLGGTAPPALILEDPDVVGRQVLYRGKTAIVKNVSAAAVARIESSVLFDAPDGAIVLAPGEAVTLQNDGSMWYIVARAP
ncbi:hypothetical protein pkur_cds_86 [Pandoravirus kuranda]|uniref:Uncharacterized protein n=1 Tax=Pandoravirus kuranda TaxID=3019033 RepID=A0AA95EMK6_9VIRU|nr:hypothetical protein pkur_cds_86 [Pandoravirus kuranda]